MVSTDSATGCIHRNGRSRVSSKYMADHITADDVNSLWKHLGDGKRVSLAAFAAQFYLEHGRPLRLAVDIAIWLFQIQSGQGGTNPILRTFYYRILRLISLNIQPLFVFDGPHKPLYKRNKKVGGPNVQTASLDDYNAKELLDKFGMPWHVAPGEAEAECAHLQMLGLVDAVLSEDVDTMMFGCTMMLRNWHAQGSSKTPTHVDIYQAQSVLDSFDIDRQGMILVAMMSGGDYLPDGIANCGAKTAVDAAKAGFGKELCALAPSDRDGFSEWRERLQGELTTNVSKYFSRRNNTIRIPNTFPNMEVLKNYTTPRVSSASKVEELRVKLIWANNFDFPALREFAAKAFDWRNIGGAKKFIRCLAPMLLTQELRLTAARCQDRGSSPSFVKAIHRHRQHVSAGNKTELRISYTPSALVPIDLSIEPEDDDLEDGPPLLSQQSSYESAALEEPFEVQSDDEGVPSTPSRKRKTRPFDPAEDAKLWVLREWIELSCPTLLGDYERQQKLSEEQKRVKSTKSSNGRTRKPLSSVNSGMPANALLRHVVTTKPGSDYESLDVDRQDCHIKSTITSDAPMVKSISMFALPSTQIPEALIVQHEKRNATSSRIRSSQADPQTPRRTKRVAAAEHASPGRPLEHYFSPSQGRKKSAPHSGAIDLTASSPVQPPMPTQSSQTAVSIEYVESAPDASRIPQQQPRVKFRKFLSMPTIFNDDPIYNTTSSLHTVSEAHGTSLQPIELSPDVAPKRRQDLQIKSTADDRRPLLPTSRSAELVSKSITDTDGPYGSAFDQSNVRSKGSHFGHRLSQVDMIDLT